MKLYKKRLQYVQCIVFNCLLDEIQIYTSQQFSANQDFLNLFVSVGGRGHWNVNYTGTQSFKKHDLIC